ncbi:MAG: Calx-beta domain-containing protein [bacterium]
MNRRVPVSTADKKPNTGRRRKISLGMDRLEKREVLATFVVNSTAPDLLATTPGSLNWAIAQANADQTPDKIIFSDTLTPNSSGVYSGLVVIDAKWLRRVTSPIEINGIELPNGSARASVEILLNGPKDLNQAGIYNIGTSILDFTSGATGSIARGLNFLNNGSAAITASNVDGVQIVQNYIGQSAQTALKRPNGSGIVLVNASNSLIQNNSINYNYGAAITVSGTNNTIVGNTITNNGAGIVVSGNGGGNKLDGNSIYLNAGNGIDIGANANNGIKAPLVTETTLGTGGRFGFGQRNLTIKGQVNGLKPNSDYKVQFFVTPFNSVLSPDKSQGRYYLQTYDALVQTNVNGNGVFSQTVNTSLASLLGASINLGDYVTATVTSVAGNDSSGFSNTSLIQRQLTVDMSVVMTADPNPVEVGDILTYTINVNNSGPDSATFVTLNDNLGPNFTFIDATTTQGTVSVNANNRLTANLGQVDPVQTAQIVVRVSPKVAGQLSNTVTVSTSSFDIDPLNNSVTTVVTALPTPKADLSMEGTFLPGTVDLGEQSIYQIKVTNNGPDIAKSVTLKSVIGNGLAFISASTDHGTVTFDQKTGTLYGNLGQVEAAGSTFVNVIVRANKVGVSSISTKVATTSIETAPSTDTLTKSITVQDLPGKIQFPFGSYVTKVGTDPVVLQVQINRAQGTLGEATVLFSTVDGTAVAGQDFVGVTDKLVTFPDGDATPQYVNVMILPSDSWFLEKSFSIKLTDANGAELGSPSTASVKILDAKPAPVGTIKIDSVTPNPVAEGSGNFVTVQVSRNDGNSKALAVTYATANGSAIAGLNYVATTGTLNWGDGETGSKTFKVPMLQDGLYSPTLNFSVNVTSANPDTVITGPTSATVSVLNTTQTSNVGFNPFTYQVLESDGVVSLQVTRNALPLVQGGTGLVPAVSVNYATVDGTAIAGIDYTAASGTLNWAQGDTSTKTVQVGIIDNTEITLDRSFTVQLSATATPNMTITQSTATVTIRNNDIDKEGPVVSQLQLAGGTAASFTQIVLTFNEPLDSATASMASNYTVQYTNTASPVPVASAQYLSASNAVVVTLGGSATKTNQFYTILVNADGPNGVKDLYGNYLNGNGKGNGSTFVNTMARGTSVLFNDDMGNRVTVGLTGGYFDITRYQSGKGRSLAVFNTNRTSVLSGTVNKLATTASGYTRFDLLSGIGQPFNINMKMTTPPFYFDKVLASNPPLPTGATPTAVRHQARNMAARSLSPKK